MIFHHTHWYAGYPFLILSIPRAATFRQIVAAKTNATAHSRSSPTFKSISAVAATAVILVAGASAEASSVYATEVYIDAGTNQDTGDSTRFGPDNALGAGNGDFYSLGIGGSALFTFGGDILGPGTIIEMTYNCSASATGTCGHYPETAQIFGVTGPVTLIEDGMIGGVQNYDLSGLDLTFIADVGNGDAMTPGFTFNTNGATYAGLLVFDTTQNASYDGFDIVSIRPPQRRSRFRRRLRCSSGRSAGWVWQKNAGAPKRNPARGWPDGARATWGRARPNLCFDGPIPPRPRSEPPHG